MTKNKYLPLRDLLGNWRKEGRFYFLKRFIDESSSSTNAAITIVKPDSISPIKNLLNRFLILVFFLKVITKCLFTSKGHTIVMNHTNRNRRSPKGLRPLYLSSTLALGDSVVFENCKLSLIYSQPVKSIQSTIIDEMAEILTGIVSRVYRFRTGVFDREIIGFHVKLAIWRMVFRLLKPKSIRLYVWYGKEAVIAAGKSLGVEVADIQHGIIYASHPLYNLTTIPQTVDCHYLLPDFCLVYGEYWRQLLIKAGWEPERVKVLGYTLDTGIGQEKEIRSPYILYTSQPHTNQIISRHILSILAECRRRGYRIVIAPHPSESSDAYNDIVGDDVSIKDYDSYDLLRDCLVHVSVSSTLLWEAMIFNKSSYVLKEGRDAPDLLSDFLNFKFGRLIDEGEFPEPFSLPINPAPDYFFRREVDQTIFESCTTKNR